MILHIREAFADAFDTLRRVNLPQLRGVFHSFTGTREELEEALSLPPLLRRDQWRRDVLRTARSRSTSPPSPWSALAGD